MGGYGKIFPYIYMIENLLSMTYKIDVDDRIHELPYGYEPKAV